MPASTSRATSRETVACGTPADDVVPYTDATRCGPVDVVLDGAGGEAFPPALEALAPLGRLVAFNGAGGPLDANELRMRGIAVIGFTMLHLVGRRPEQYEAQRAELWKPALSRRLRARVHATLPQEQAEEAHRIVRARENRGRVVLAPCVPRRGISLVPAGRGS